MIERLLHLVFTAEPAQAGGEFGSEFGAHGADAGLVGPCLDRKDSSLKGRRFAVIADEAHSSQSGQISSKLEAVLTAEEVDEIEEGGEVDVETILAAEMTARAESAAVLSRSRSTAGDTYHCPSPR